MKPRLNPRVVAPAVLSAVISLTFAAGALAADGAKTFKIEDDCEATTFNAVLGDGACVGNGKTTFAEFIAELEATQVAQDWRIRPSKSRLNVGRPTTIENAGGETHTFTRVASFGGGFVPELNGLSGNPVPAPECLDFGAMVFIPAGATLAGPTAGGAGLPGGTNRFQCCIHPWQRTVIEVVEK